MVTGSEVLFLVIGGFWWDISVSRQQKSMGSGTMSRPTKENDAGLENVSLSYLCFRIFILNMLDGGLNGGSKHPPE